MSQVAAFLSMTPAIAAYAGAGALLLFILAPLALVFFGGNDDAHD